MLAGNRPQGIQPRKGSSRKYVTRHTEYNRLYPITPSPQDPPVPVQSRGRKRKGRVLARGVGLAGGDLNNRFVTD
ncbi:uncharacterized protein B0H64DRAFT_51546 [Chaetomium fimeti]|uniref:Uncharacterized protein n=1 Tax=Chaetomium fimeti TaxID=1854472 RepID=A0AAE0LMX1_9PEZI|nr:hypothetical protein B0H64DRAFT_51546 [Chaetomium fimeti]